MSIDQDVLSKKKENAIAVLNAFADCLDSHRHEAFSPAFRDMAKAIDQGGMKRAVELDKNTRRGGMGSLSDIYICDADGEYDASADARFSQLSSAASTVITNIRLYLSYEKDRPLVDISQAPVVEPTRQPKWWQFGKHT